MNKKIVKELAGYASLLKRMEKDNRLLPTHLGLFTGLFICWQRNGFVSPFGVTRKTLMAFSKVASIATYHKCIKELDEYGYIHYEPSYHPRLGSQIHWPTDLEV
ncbi:hypothetical protein [Mucilaginibacter flavus]|uniref:hypothetical protein n=1 Tax=Mucilaginibacter flavus TaxID=931504 RepID=UPI003F496B66